MEPHPSSLVNRASATAARSRPPHEHIAWELKQFLHAMSGAGVQSTQRTSGSSRLSVINIRSSDLGRAAKALASLEGSWVVSTQRFRMKQTVSATQVDSYLRTIRKSRSFFVWCEHPLMPASPETPRGIRIDVWNEVPRSERGERVWEHRTAFGSVYRMGEREWNELAKTDRPSVPHLFSVPSDIDVVYTWVDDQDDGWQKALRKHLARTDLTEVHESAYARARFREGDYLRYSLRSLETYAPWVRHVYIVTAGQRPAWLDESYPHVTVVTHEEIFADHSQLPTFNSHAIEANLHHIEGLSEHFLYMNDDVFFGNIVFPEDFFHASGLSKFFLSRNPIPVGKPNELDLPVDAAAKQTRDLVVREWGREPSHKYRHTPHPLSRSVLESLDSIFATEIDRTRGNALRHPSDVSLASSLAHAAGYAMGRAVPGTITYRYIDVSDPNSPRVLSRLEKAREYQTFCLNEVEGGGPVDQAVGERVRAFLERYYPEPSGFERPSDS